MSAKWQVIRCPLMGTSPVAEIRSFQDLKIWQGSRDRVEKNQLTSELPMNGEFNPVPQLRRVAISAPSNIAAGSAP